MSHTIYSTKAIVLSRVDTAEADLTLWLLTQDLGLVIARATGARKEAAKMRSHLQTFAVSSVSLVRGKHLWRLTGAESLSNDLVITNNEALVVFANISRFIRRMTVASGGVELYQLLLGIRRELASAGSAKELYKIETLAMAKILIELGYMSARALNKASINLQELTTDINKAITESHL